MTCTYVELKADSMTLTDCGKSLDPTSNIYCSKHLGRENSLRLTPSQIESFDSAISNNLIPSSPSICSTVIPKVKEKSIKEITKNVFFQLTIGIFSCFCVRSLKTE